MGNTKRTTVSKKDSTLFWKGIMHCTFAYILATAAAIFAGSFFSTDQLLLQVGVADIAGTLVIFLFSYVYKNSSFYDAYWSVGPILIALYLLYLGLESGADYTRQMVVTALVLWWGFRLTYNWMRGWTGLEHIDWRYVDLKEKHGNMYWLVSFSGIHMFPTALVFMGCLPLFHILTENNSSFNTIDILATILTFTAIFIEALADHQLHRFVTTNTEKGKIFKTGIWKYSRHPNYFGEMTFWWGLFLFGIAANPSYWWTIIGPLSISLLFVFISIPMIDERSIRRRPGYAEHMKKVSGFLPLPPKP